MCSVWKNRVMHDHINKLKRAEERIFLHHGKELVLDSYACKNVYLKQNIST